MLTFCRYVSMYCLFGVHCSADVYACCSGIHLLVGVGVRVGGGYLFCWCLCRTSNIGFLLCKCVPFSSMPFWFAIYMWYLSIVSIVEPLLSTFIISIMSSIGPYECPVLSISYIVSIVFYVSDVFLIARFEVSTCVSNILLLTFCTI
jgi:hypothetical protein